MTHSMPAAGSPARVVASAPGRVNLLGEHTDYNDGFVLPIAIVQQTRVSMHANGSDRFNVRAPDLDAVSTFTLDAAPAEPFARYVFGCLKAFSQRGAPIMPLDIDISSDVPIGVGLSSSAALEVAMLRALRRLLDDPLDDVELALLAQRVEVEYAGVHCGIMDQMASSLANASSMLLLDVRTLERRLLALPAGAEIVVIDSGIARSLANTDYNQRRAQCEQAAKLLGVAALRDVATLADVERLPDPLRRRARHVVSENERVLEAAAGAGAVRFGELMNASHASLRDDYEVSVPALDRLVGLLQAHPDVYGARLTGAGFGGACVGLCRAGRSPAVARSVLDDYARLGLHGRSLVPPAV